MRTYTGFSLLVFAITALAIAQAGPAYAAQPAAGLNNAMLALSILETAPVLLNHPEAIILVLAPLVAALASESVMRAHPRG